MNLVSLIITQTIIYISVWAVLMISETILNSILVVLTRKDENTLSLIASPNRCTTSGTDFRTDPYTRKTRTYVINILYLVNIGPVNG